jgi:2-haloacid dehalogenase
VSEQTDLTGVKALMFGFYGTVVDMQGGLIEAITPYLESKQAGW